VEIRSRETEGCGNQVEKTLQGSEKKKAAIGQKKRADSAKEKKKVSLRTRKEAMHLEPEGEQRGAKSCLERGRQVLLSLRGNGSLLRKGE